jgi:hypothetical protein
MIDFRDPIWQGIASVLAVITALSALINWLWPQLRTGIHQWSQRSLLNRGLIIASVAIFIVTLAWKLSSPIQPYLVIVDNTSKDIFIIEGQGIKDFVIGDELVVYGEVIPDIEEPIGLLRVISENPNSLSAQIMLKKPNFEIRARFRVDGNLSKLSTSQLEPVTAEGVGYLLEAGKIMLRIDSNVTEIGSILLALEPQLKDQLIVGYLPYQPPVVMKVVQLDSTEKIARLELLSGSWPDPGTILARKEEENSQMDKEILYRADFNLFTPESYDCVNYTYDNSLDEWQIEVNCARTQANSFIPQVFPDFELEIVTKKLSGNNHAWYGIVIAAGYKTDHEVHHRFMISGLGTYTYEIATYSPDGKEQIKLDIKDPFTNSPYINRENDQNNIKMIRRGSIIEFWVNDNFVLARDIGIGQFEPVNLAPSVIMPKEIQGNEEEYISVGFSDFVVFEP